MAKKVKTTDLTEQLVQTIVSGIQELKGKEIVIMDLRKVQNASTDFFVICHGSSTTQVEAIARSIEKETETKMNESPWIS